MSERVMPDINGVIAAARKAKSLMERDEMEWLCKMAWQAPDGIGLEVGVYCAASLIAWSLMREGRGVSVGVDNWSYRDIQYLKMKAENNLYNAGITATLMDMDSVIAAQMFHGELAFCFIDGDHTYPAIDNDIEAWIPKMMVGGIVVFHDYGRRKGNCAVDPAIEKWQKRQPWERLGMVNTTIAFRRPA